MKLKDTGLTFQDIKDKVNKYMIETYERFDFLAETAEGMYIYDENKTPYLDFYAGIAVNSAGNCNPKVVAAAKDQLDDIMHTFNYPYTIPQALLAEKVCETIGMDKIFYQNSGTEANEAMIKMARKYGIEKYGPNRYHIVTAKMGFHGRTFGAIINIVKNALGLFAQGENVFRGTTCIQSLALHFVSTDILCSCNVELTLKPTWHVRSGLVDQTGYTVWFTARGLLPQFVHESSHRPLSLCASRGCVLLPVMAFG